jgi:beta-aspartyl-peptidase (threonine type)
MAVGLLVHGGAGFVRKDDHEALLVVCREAVAAGRALLQHSAVDAVEAAVRVLEANPLFNAGYGSVLNRDGNIEMDAMILDGTKPRIGAVAGVSRVEHPVSLARLVMERTPHHLMIGDGAEQLARDQGMPLVAPEKMIAPNRLAEMQRDPGSDTVGAVALDSEGNLAVAVSTGGIRGKLPGRVGDSPLLGAGGYADNGLGAACATGVGEGIIRALLTYRAVDALRTASNAQQAAEQAIQLFGERFEGEGGLIMIDAQGNVGIAHNTPFLPTAWLESGQDILTQIAQPKK